jgi:hypothetical protein
MGGPGEVVAQGAQMLLGFAVAWALFAAIFRILPDTNMSWPPRNG